MKLTYFKDIDFLQAIKGLFKELKVPMNYVADEPTTAKEILKDTYKDNSTFALADDVYFVGMVDDAAFDDNESLAVDKIKSDYDGILIFGITLHQRENNLLPTRSQLAEISRAFNREFYYTPVVLVFKYKDDTTNYIAFANTERLKYKQEWREGEKTGKVSLLRDINIEKPHRGHEDIINQLKIPTSGKNQVDSFAKLYTYWQEVFNVNLLNKKFYQELSNWYFWAIKHVTFPNKPTKEDAHKKGVDFDELVQEHNAKNVIRMLTRLLFTWFIKEKKLIPEDLFDLDSLQEDILKDISPYHEVGAMFTDANKDSVYYKAILQNLFFASLNCPIEADGLDNRKRGFRGLETYGKHRGIDWMMRYKNHFKNPDKFLEMMNKTVPFLNGGLFECLDDKTQNLYVDGFSDQMTKGEKLIVPDYLFFGIEEKVDLSTEYGAKNKAAKAASVKGLINILKSYKFTITENTPIEEDVALDPELLGKVFENLLASYNPETKTTARKQTGSFYTPREIVNYMVDESLIAYLKNSISDWNRNDEKLDENLHSLFSFDQINPFEDEPALQKQIIKALDKCTILDPACGSGAFPMGALQKMVHVLHKVDSNGQDWKQRQIDKVNNAIESLEEIDDSQIREQSIKDLELQKQDIADAFENNELDYGRKLFLIENCIYGVDIQSIATQISKLRFFISLVVDQKINPNKENFGIRPLPNLETKFVAANTLIGIEKPTAQTNLFDTQEVKALEKELKKIRHKLFNAKTKKTKLAHRQKDEELRNAIAKELIKSGWTNDTADKLASWDPYDQNASSPFFDSEWMFDIKGGFDVVIGNPPYINANELKKKLGKTEYQKLKSQFVTARGTIDIYILFYEFGLKALCPNGLLTYITPNRYLSASYGEALREFIFANYSIKIISDFSGVRVFEAASTYPIVTLIGKNHQAGDDILVRKFNTIFEVEACWMNKSKDLELLPGKIWGFLLNSKIDIVKKMIPMSDPMNSCGTINATSTANEADIYHQLINEKSGIKLVNTGTIDRYQPLWGEVRLTDKGETYLTPFLSENEEILSQKRHNLYLSPKIILAKIAIRTEAFFDNKGEYSSINTNCIHSFNKGFDPKYTTTWINSLLFQFVFSCFFDGLRMAGGYLLYSAPNIKSLFIKKPNQTFSDMFCLLHDFINLKASKNESSIVDSIIDGLFFELFFPAHMKEKEIDVLQFVEKDIETVMQGRDFEKLNDTEKDEVIDQLHKTWSHPDNEVRNRIKLFAVRSPDILKPILES